MTSTTTNVPVGRDVPKVVWSWAMFDWANSAFTTLVVTFIYSAYFAKGMAPDETTGTLWWSQALAISSILIALASPLVGAAADRGQSRRYFLTISTLVCVGATAALALVSPDMAHGPLIALVVFVIANIAFELGNVLYNSFLPDIVAPARIGRVSGFGWGLGYVGGIFAMGLALVGFVQPEVPWFGMSTDAGWNIRATNLLVAVWFLIFALPMLLLVPESRRRGSGIGLVAAFGELRQTARNLGRYREIVKFLVARLAFNDGLVTIISFGGIYAQAVFGMTMSELIAFGVVLNATSGVGAFAFGFVDDRIGGKKTVLLTIAGLMIATVIAVWAPTRTWFWVAGVIVGIFIGPNQSASRSLMGRFVPDKHEAEFFGFFGFSGKATAFVGPLLLGIVTRAFDSHRVGMATVLLFFIAGGVLLWFVDEQKGIAAAKS